MTLKQFLTRLIWLSLLPLILLAAYLAYASVRANETARQVEAENLARNFATAIDQRLEARIGALRVLAESPLADGVSRLGDFYREAQAYHQNFDSPVVLADPEMRMWFSTRLPFGSVLPILPRPQGHAAAPAALHSGEPAVGDIFFGPIAKEPLIAIAVPGKRQGKTAFLLLATVEARQFQMRLNKEALPSGWSLTLFDGNGEPIARRVPPGFNSATDVDDSARFVVKSALSPWSVTLEIPRANRRSRLLAATAALGLLIVTAALLGALGGTLAGRRLATAVTTIGRTPAANTPALNIVELATVRGLLDETAERRKSAEDEIRAQVDQLRFVADHAPVLIAHCDQEQRYRFVNRAYAEMFGLQPADLIDKHPREVLGAQAYAHAQSYMELALAGQSVTYDLELPTTPAGPRAVQVSYAPEHDASGRIVGFLAAILDISERKANEVKIQDQLDELMRWQTVVVSREERMLQLKAEINQLLVSQGLPPRYADLEAQ